MLMASWIGTLVLAARQCPFTPGEVAGITKAQFSPAVVVVLALPLPGIRKSLTLAPALGYGLALQTVGKP